MAIIGNIPYFQTNPHLFFLRIPCCFNIQSRASAVPWSWWRGLGAKNRPAKSNLDEPMIHGIYIYIHMGMDQHLLIPFVSGMNIHKSQLFWCEQKGYKVLTHCHMIRDIHEIHGIYDIHYIHDIRGWAGSGSGFSDVTDRKSCICFTT